MGANHGGCAPTISPPMKIKSHILVAISSLSILAADRGRLTSRGQCLERFLGPFDLSAERQTVHALTRSDVFQNDASD